MRTINISGFRGSYEWACQRMLQLGIEWLKSHPAFDFSAYQSFRNVFGLVTVNHATDQAKLAEELNTVLTMDAELAKSGGPTGAMHHAVLQHLYWIKKSGYEGWLAELEKKNPADAFFEFDGTLKSCPETEFSRKMDKR